MYINPKPQKKVIILRSIEYQKAELEDPFRRPVSGGGICSHPAHINVRVGFMNEQNKLRRQSNLKDIKEDF